jgi:hypothetical protein
VTRFRSGGSSGQSSTVRIRSTSGEFRRGNDLYVINDAELNPASIDSPENPAAVAAAFTSASIGYRPRE